MGLVDGAVKLFNDIDRRFQAADRAMARADQLLAMHPIQFARALSARGAGKTAVECADCQAPEYLGTAYTLVRGIAERCPVSTEPPPQGVRGVFPVAGRVLDKAIAELPKLTRTEATRSKIERLEQILPDLKRRVQHIPTCAEAASLSRDLEAAWSLVYDVSAAAFTKPPQEPACSTCGGQHGVPETKKRKLTELFK